MRINLTRSARTTALGIVGAGAIAAMVVGGVVVTNQASGAAGSGPSSPAVAAPAAAAPAKVAPAKVAAAKAPVKAVPAPAKAAEAPAAAVPNRPRPAAHSASDAEPAVPVEVPFPAFVVTPANEDVTSDEPPSSGALPDGHYVGLPSSIDLSARTVDLDLVLFYGGKAAEAAFTEDTGIPYDPEGPALNNYYAINRVTRMRTLPLADDVLAGMPGKVAEHKDLTHFRVSLTALSASIADRQSQLDGVNKVWAEYGTSYVWITVQGGVVTAIDGQYTP